MPSTSAPRASACNRDEPEVEDGVLLPSALANEGRNASTRPTTSHTRTTFFKALSGANRGWLAGINDVKAGSKPSKAASVSDRQTTHLNTGLVAYESLWPSNTS